MRANKNIWQWRILEIKTKDSWFKQYEIRKKKKAILAYLLNITKILT